MKDRAESDKKSRRVSSVMFAPVECESLEFPGNVDPA